MFSRQAPVIDHALWQGGLSPAQASVVSNALGQCRAPLTHRAPITVDYATPDMRLILPDDVPGKFPDIPLQPPEIFPPRPPQPHPPEELPPSVPNPLPPKDPIAPVQPPSGAPGGGPPGFPPEAAIPPWLAVWMARATAAFNALKKEFEAYKANLQFEAGEYLDIDDANQTTRYKLKTLNDTEGFVCTFGTDEIVGKDFEEMIDDHSEKILEAIKDENDGIPANQVSVLTSVVLTDSGLEFTQQTISVLDAGASGAGPTIPVVDCP
jgi:hypothetical protein